MTPEKRAHLEARGYQVSNNIGDVLGLTEADRQVVAFRTELTRKVRALRGGRGLTQAQLAAIVGVSESHLPNIDGGRASLDTIAAVIVALDRALDVRIPPPPPGRPSRPRGMARRKTKPTGQPPQV